MIWLTAHQRPHQRRRCVAAHRVHGCQIRAQLFYLHAVRPRDEFLSRDDDVICLLRRRELQRPTGCRLEVGARDLLEPTEWRVIQTRLRVVLRVNENRGKRDKRRVRRR